MEWKLTLYGVGRKDTKQETLFTESTIHESMKENEQWCIIVLSIMSIENCMQKTKYAGVTYTKVNCT